MFRFAFRKAAVLVVAAGAAATSTLILQTSLRQQETKGVIVSQSNGLSYRSGGLMIIPSVDEENEADNTLKDGEKTPLPGEDIIEDEIIEEEWTEHNPLCDLTEDISPDTSIDFFNNETPEPGCPLCIIFADHTPCGHVMSRYKQCVLKDEKNPCEDEFYELGRCARRYPIYYQRRSEWLKRYIQQQQQKEEEESPATVAATLNE